MICYHLTHASSELLLDLLKAPGLIMVCYGNVSSMRHIYGKSFDNTRQHIFLKTNARKSRSQWSLNCICTDSVNPRCVHKSNLGFLGCMLVDTISFFLSLYTAWRSLSSIIGRCTLYTQDFSRSDGSGKGA